ncbi:MAG: DUF3426 domain-containing protein [Proteobacteria bacterium]|nr:DUF3426 domain-containing protein [Pseudomonadota bacterium]
MKLTCPFCKTEYAADVAPGAAVACACCGHAWRTGGKRRVPVLWLMTLACFVLALSVFAGVVFVRNNEAAAKQQEQPLAIQVSNVRTVADADGQEHFMVSGTIRNQSAAIHGVPDLVVSLRDADGNVIITQKFLPPVPLLDAGETAEFAHTVAEFSADAKKVGVEFK